MVQGAHFLDRCGGRKSGARYDFAHISDTLCYKAEIENDTLSKAGRFVCSKCKHNYSPQYATTATKNNWGEGGAPGVTFLCAVQCLMSRAVIVLLWCFLKWTERYQVGAMSIESLDILYIACIGSMLHDIDTRRTNLSSCSDRIKLLCPLDTGKQKT